MIIFSWSEIGSGFEDPGGTPPPRIPRSTPPPRVSAIPCIRKILLLSLVHEVIAMHGMFKQTCINIEVVKLLFSCEITLASSRLRRSLVGSAAKTLFRVRLQYRQLRRLNHIDRIAILTVTSPIVINVPTRGLLAVEAKDSFVLWLAKFKYQKTCL